MRFLIIITAIMIGSCNSQGPSPKGDFIALLEFPTITYHIYLNWNEELPILVNTTFKAEEFSLDTIFFSNDSLHFRLKDFYSEFVGRYDAKTYHIKGQWISEDSTIFPLEFVPALSDTVSGLHPRTTSDYNYQPPPQQSDGIPIDHLMNQSIDTSLMHSLTQHIVNGTFTDVHSLLVARNNRLVYEEYFYRIHRESVYNIQSATKSFVSALTGVALDKGEIKNLDETLCTYLEDYKTYTCNPQYKDITLRQVLTMSTGIEWDEQTYDYIDDRNSLAIAANELDQFVHLLSLPKVQSATPVFAYNSLNHLLMNSVLRQSTQLENKQELIERLLNPLGIAQYNLGEPTPMGVIGDIGLRPRDMLKFGLMYLNEGRWNGKQIIPADWVHESTTSKITPARGLGYGYFWWTKGFQWKGAPVSSFFAWGYGGQYIFVVPTLKMVLVMSGSKWSTDPTGQAMEMVQRVLDAAD